MRALLVFLLILYLCLPHHLLELFGGDALKSYDIPAALIFLCLVPRLGRLRFDTVYLDFGLFAAWYLFRALFSVNAVGLTSVFYGAKFAEYFFVCAAADSMGRDDLHRVLLWVVGVAFVLGIGELFGLQLTVVAWNNRLTAQFGGPYELGAVALLLAIIVRDAPILKSMGIAGVVLSGAKASLMGYFAFLARRLHDIKWVVVIVVVSAAVALLFGDRIEEFSESLSFFTDVDSMQKMYDSVPVTANFDDYQTQWLQRDNFSAGLDVDMSTGLRLYSWVLAIKSLTPWNYLFGEGPGYFTSALDSSILRVFVETGLVGIILLWRFIAALLRATRESGLGIAIAVNMLFVDVLFSARYLVVLLILHRLYSERSAARSIA